MYDARVARTLIILRHGKAEPDAVTGRDEDRALARLGFRQIDFVSEQLLEREREPVLIATSFIKRARQSTDALAEAFDAVGVPCKIIRERALEFGHESATTDGLGDLITGLFRRHKRGPVILIGHNPQLERLVNITDARGGPAGIQLKTGMACVLTIVDPADPINSAKLEAQIRHEP